MQSNSASMRDFSTLVQETKAAPSGALVAVEGVIPPLGSVPPKNKGGRPKGSKKGVSVRKVKGQVKVARETTLALTHKLLSGASDRVVAEIIRKALDSSDKDQSAMLKLCIDRIAPIAAFERANAGQANKVEVVVTLAAEGSLSPTISAVQEGSSPSLVEVIDVEAKEVRNEVKTEDVVVEAAVVELGASDLDGVSGAAGNAALGF